MPSNKHLLQLAVLGALLWLGACSQDLYQVADDFRIDLGVAQADRQDRIHLLLDDGKKIYPRNCDYVFETGKRYKLHYTLTASHSQDSAAWEAELLDIFPVQVIPLTWEPDPELMKQPKDAVKIDRFWLGGGYLNVALSYRYQDNAGQHRFLLVSQGYTDKTLTVELQHYPDTDGTGAEQAGVTLSFPLSSMIFYPEADNLTVRVTETDHSGNMVVRNYDLPGGNKQR